MIVIPKHVQEFLPGKMGWVATATKDGVPNTTPKGSIRVLDDQHIVFADLFSFKTRQNLEQNPRVAVTVVDMASHMGYLGHPERDMPFCARHYRVLDDAGTLLFECADNHQTRNTIRLAAPVSTTELRIEILSTHGASAAIFELRCYA